MTNSMDPDQTAPIGAVGSGSMLFASIPNSSVMLSNYLQHYNTRRHFQMHFFLGALRVKTIGFFVRLHTIKSSILKGYRF